MDITVGGGNPVRRRIVERTYPNASVAAVVVDSGVSERSADRDETITGAVTRAERAPDANGYDFDVGIEGGITTFSADDGTDEIDLYLVMQVAVTDDECTGRTAGLSLTLPTRIAGRIDTGKELDPVMGNVLGTGDIVRNEGAMGAFTGGRLTRTGALELVAMDTFVPFRCELY